MEAIPEADILAHADEKDTDNDGISGKPNYVFDRVSGKKQLGRFGWKANTATLLEQCAAAYLNDMGITNSLFPYETGPDDSLRDDPELSDKILESVAFYCRTLAVPASRNHDLVRKGASLFEKLGCAKCHIPEFRTGASPVPALSYQTIFPYTDMLLHNMGDDLADNRPDYQATGSEWKTRPLWGIGLTRLINGHTRFLHDGRAGNLTEAILWHGGEALSSKNGFKQLPEADRQALLDFLNSL
ncbi:MAG: c-type cytochrome [Leadbetterella sp.]|nr:c-type cytochrome [Leadbetterella sp.]